MIHVHGGSVLLEKIAQAGIPGERLEWLEVLCQGPTPAGLSDDAWYAMRAAFLTAYAGLEADDLRRQLAAQDEALERATDHDEIVLWFGPELFCQTILIRLLAHFASRTLGRTRLSLISVDRYPGVDDRRSCTISALSGEQLTDVFAQRPTVTPAQLALGRRAWDALGAPTPEPLTTLAQERNEALPFLSAALRRLLAELPDVTTGLSRTERLILDALASGPQKAGQLFVTANEPEPRRWITDTILIDHLRRLAAGNVPLLEVRENGGGEMGAEVRRRAVAADICAGRTDALALRGIDRWVGGTHLTTDNVWRWEERASRVVKT